MLIQEQDSSSTSRRWAAWETMEKPANISARSHRKNYCGEGGWGQARPWCFGYTRKEGAQVPVERAEPLPSQHSTSCWTCPLACSSHHLFLPTALLRTETGNTRPLAINERRCRLMRGLKLFSFPSPCKPTPVHPSCAHSQGFDWNLSFTQ